MILILRRVAHERLFAGLYYCLTIAAIENK